MANGIRTGDSCGFNKGHGWKFREGTEFDKHLKKARGQIGRNSVEITIKMKTIVRKSLTIPPHNYTFSMSQTVLLQKKTSV